VDRSSGIVVFAEGGALARRPSRIHRLVVVARDRGSLPLQTVADLIVAVNDSAAAALRGGEVPGRQGGVAVTVAVVSGAVVGGVLVMGCLIVVAVVVCCLRRRRSKRRRHVDELEKYHHCSR